VRLLESARAGLDRHPARDLAHRGEERQTASLIGHGLVGDACRARADERVGLGPVGREVEISEQDVIRPQQVVLDRLRFLDLDDQLGVFVDARRVGQDLRPGGAVAAIVEVDLDARPRLDEHAVTVPGQLPD
jgi:hypothetical protein